MSYLSSVDTNGYVQLEGCQTLQAISALKVSLESGVVFTLQQCLMCANEFSATIPHDKTFSMLVLAGDAVDLALDPTYEESEQKLYTNVTRYLFTRDRSFELLNIAGIGYSRLLDGLSSWVPDFSHRRKSTVLGYRDQYAIPVPSNARFERSDEMTITGMYVDELQKLRESIPVICRSLDRTQSKQSRADMNAWLNTSKEWATTFDLGGSRRDLEVSFWRTLLCGMLLAKPFASRDRISEEYPDLFEAYLYIFRATVDLPMPPDVEAAAMSALFEESNALVKIVMECRGRRLFRTKTGYINLGPAGLATDDKVFIIDGTITPFLFREINSESVVGTRDMVLPANQNLCPSKGALVGECYVDGIIKDAGRIQGLKKQLVLI